jgi:hypothetical protein
MIRKYTQQDLDILQSYQKKGQCKRYWNYLANMGERYAALAPGVLFEDEDGLAPPHHFYWTQYRSGRNNTASKTECLQFGQALMKADLAQRSVLLLAGGREAAMHLSASHIYLQHKRVLRHISGWTPMAILQPFYDSNNPNINVAQKIWDGFVDMADIYAEQTTQAETLGAISIFQAQLFWLAKQDPRALDEKVRSWIERDILPVMLAVATDGGADGGAAEPLPDGNDLE